MAEETSTSEAYPSSAFVKFACLLSNAPAMRETVAKVQAFDAYPPKTILIIQQITFVWSYDSTNKLSCQLPDFEGAEEDSGGMDPVCASEHQKFAKPLLEGEPSPVAL